ncbi:zinc-ribbon domain-containing protein [Acidimangrovimonas pyrenivorans]|uniref:Zinc-ribbon domain-containing protein n=1 Tax=Acidimangrovimonas pyrenivorans TaxID=2030798 RepID=A0ABV7AGE6_9RHOB
MRLTCPNCDAQYEVDDRAIPESGRDVQCSNCGHAWFQLPPDAEARLQEAARQGTQVQDAAEQDTAVQDAAVQDTAAGDYLPESTAGVDTAADFDPESFDAESAEAPLPEPPPAAAAPSGMERRRRELDEGVLNVLREEAERETAARKAEGGGLETQTELGLEAPGSALPAAEITRRSGEREETPAPEAAAAEEAPREAESEPPREVAAAAPEAPAVPRRPAAAEGRNDATGSRRDLLPDIEEINSTLRANSERERGEPGGMAAAEAPAERRRGFRLGFGLVLGLVALLLLAYTSAPRIVAKWPAAGPAMQSYVAAVDRGRVWLDGQMQTAVRMLRPVGAAGDGGAEDGN